MEREYWVTKEEGVRFGINVDKFKTSVEKAIRHNIETEYDYKVYQRCYKDGRWKLTIYTVGQRVGHGYREKWALRWDEDNIDYIIGIICNAFHRWLRIQSIRMEQIKEMLEQ